MCISLGDEVDEHYRNTLHTPPPQVTISYHMWEKQVVQKEN